MPFEGGILETADVTDNFMAKPYADYTIHVNSGTAHLSTLLTPVDARGSVRPADPVGLTPPLLGTTTRRPIIVVIQCRVSRAPPDRMSRIRTSFRTTDLAAAALGVTEEIDASVTLTAASAPTCGKQ